MRCPYRDPNLAVVAIHQRVRAAFIALGITLLLRLSAVTLRCELVSPIRPGAGGMLLEAVFVHLGIGIRAHDSYSFSSQF